MNYAVRCKNYVDPLWHKSGSGINWESKYSSISEFEKVCFAFKPYQFLDKTRIIFMGQPNISLMWTLDLKNQNIELS